MKIAFLLLLLSTSALAGEFPRWEVRTSPLALLVRWFTLEPGYRPAEHWAVGPTYTRYSGSSNFIFGGRVGRAVGLFGTYYFQSLPGEGAYMTLRWQREKYTEYPSSEVSRPVVEQRDGGTLTLLGGYRPVISGPLFALFGGGLQRQRFDVVRWRLFVEAKLGVEL